MNHHIHVPLFSKTNKIIVLSAAAIFILNSALRVYAAFDLNEYLGLSLTGILSGKVFQIVTYVVAQASLLSMLFNGLIVWFIGGDLEVNWGARFYRKFLLVLVLGTGCFFLLSSAIFWGLNSGYIFVGLEALTLGLLVAYGMVFKDRYLTFMFIFPMKATYFCLLLCGVQLYQALFSPYSKTAWAHVFSMILAYLYLKFTSMQARGEKLTLFKAKKKPSHLKIVKDDDNPPKYWH